MEEFAKELEIKTEGNYNEDKDSYIIDLKNSDDYGYAYIKLENSDLVQLMEDNQVITEEGSSLMYEAVKKPYLINLLASVTIDD